MQKLAAISLIFLPLTFIAGVYGMNFTHMPELQWEFGYAMVWIVYIVIAVIVVFIKLKKNEVALKLCIQKGIYVFKTTFSHLIFAAHSMEYPPCTRKRDQIDFSMPSSQAVSAWELMKSGYNWAVIKMLSKVRDDMVNLADPELRSVAGASAGSINALMTAMYWCQKEDVPLKNSVEDNLFYETWVNLGY